MATNAAWVGSVSPSRSLVVRSECDDPRPPIRLSIVTVDSDIYLCDSVGIVPNTVDVRLDTAITEPLVHYFGAILVIEP